MNGFVMIDTLDNIDYGWSHNLFVSKEESF